MKKIFVFSFLLFSLAAICQKPSLLDTTMQKAIFLSGYRDTKIDFKTFSAKTITGNIYTNDSLKNKVTFINFWFEACAPCIAEFDALNSLNNKYKGDKNFQFLSFTYETNENITRIANEHHLEYPILHIEKEKIYDLIFKLGFPTNIITDQSGNIRYIKCGGFTDEKKAQEEFDSVYAKEVERLLFAN
jgi:thiol-disulfide isomerase/thioredoxin